ncbi:hypothetical protein [Marinoscillum luteum]|uniref:Uncharacterized protein n=1 Tax=Marinoscillum luteum TaxID=861051 RepID=A0ABW7N795_9BACT
MTERKRNVIRFLRHEEDRNLLLSDGSKELTVTGSQGDLGATKLNKTRSELEALFADLQLH